MIVICPMIGCSLLLQGTLLLAAHLGKSEGSSRSTTPLATPSAPSSLRFALAENSTCVEGRVQLPSSTYVDLILASVAEIPSVLFCAFIANNWGRKVGSGVRVGRTQLAMHGHSINTHLLMIIIFKSRTSKHVLHTEVLLCASLP